MRDAAEREACLLDDVAVEFEPDCDGNKRERIREPVTDFQIRVVLRETLRRQLHRSDDLVGIEAGVALRCIARQPVEVRKRDHAVARDASNVDLRLQYRERDAHVRWVDRDAGFARTEDRVHAIVAVNGGAAAAGLSFVAGRRSVVEVMAARTLEEISACRGHVAQLLRGAGHDRAGENRITLLDERVISEIGVAHERADTQAAAGHAFDLLERQPSDVDQWRLVVRHPSSSNRSDWCRRR